MSGSQGREREKEWLDRKREEYNTRRILYTYTYIKEGKKEIAIERKTVRVPPIN